ncbi:MAG: MerR family DNA-binding transcriptional regulator, partial [Clostridiaceae bacterium]|nr:MerR family DNA-binding transcriptional regulator [Clostridiaceae bacterium]
MYSIGVFSQINKVTTKTLRHYDEINLLKPEYVDKFTGYRY